MLRNTSVLRVLSLGLVVVATSLYAAQKPDPKASFVMNGTDAGLTHVRAVKTVLDDGRTKKPGYMALVSAKPASGDISEWRSADPAKQGSFIFLMLEENGDIWIAELGHTARRSGRFGVVLELKKVGFSVKDGEVTGQYRTEREQTFGDDRYTIDLSFKAPLEGK